MGFSDFENPLSGAILAGSASLHVHMAGSNGRHSRPQQFDARAAVHGALKRLQAIDLALGLAAAPRFRDGVSNRLNIPAHRPGAPTRESLLISP